MTYAHVDKRALTVVIGFRATFYKKTYIHIYIYIFATQPRGLVIETVPTPLRYTTPLCCDRGACDYGPLAPKP